MNFKLGFIALLFSQLALAEPIVFIYTGTGSGSLNGSDFSDTDFTVTGSADTVDIESCGGGCLFVNHSSTQIVLDGIGTYSFTTDLRTFFNPNTVGLSRAGNFGLDLYNSASVPEMDGWDMTYAIGPVTPQFFLLQWGSEDVVTDGGVLIFDYEEVSGSFEAVLGPPADLVPVPAMSTWSIALLVGLIALIAYRRRLQYG